MMLDEELKDWGNSYGVRISKSMAKRLGIVAGDRINMDVVKKHPGPFPGLGICKGAAPFVREHNDRF